MSSDDFAKRWSFFAQKLNLLLSKSSRTVDIASNLVALLKTQVEIAPNEKILSRMTEQELEITRIEIA